MGLVTGSVLGNVETQDNMIIEGAPYIYFQRYDQAELNKPDGSGYYWGLTGTTQYPAYLLGCIQDVSLGEDVTMNAVRCDTSGDKDVVQRRNHLEFSFSLTSLMPLSVLAYILGASTPTVVGAIEKMGIGNINNNLYWHVYAPKVYDEATGDYLAITLHRAKFVDAWTINMKAGEPWQVTGIKLWAFADDTMPAGQEFATVIRADPSLVP